MPTRSAYKCAQLLHITSWTLLWRPMNVRSVAARSWQLNTQNSTQSTRTIMTTDCSTDRRRTAPVTKKLTDLPCPLCDSGSSSWDESVACQLARGSGPNAIYLGRGPDMEAQQDGESTTRTRQRQQSRTTCITRRGRKHDLAHTGEQRCPITAGLADRDHCAA